MSYFALSHKTKATKKDIGLQSIMIEKKKNQIKYSYKFGIYINFTVIIKENLFVHLVKNFIALFILFQTNIINIFIFIKSNGDLPIEH